MILLLTLNIFHKLFFSDSIVDFEQVDVTWEFYVQKKDRPKLGQITIKSDLNKNVRNISEIFFYLN